MISITLVLKVTSAFLSTYELLFLLLILNLSYTRLHQGKLQNPLFSRCNCMQIIMCLASPGSLIHSRKAEIETFVMYEGGDLRVNRPTALLLMCWHNGGGEGARGGNSILTSDGLSPVRCRFVSRPQKRWSGVDHTSVDTHGLPVPCIVGGSFSCHANCLVVLKLQEYWIVLHVYSLSYIWNPQL